MVIIETPVFTRLVRQWLSEEDYRLLQGYLNHYPDAGDVIPGSGGLRKIRWNAFQKGKRGGVRVIYYWATRFDQILMLYIYPKNRQDDLTFQQLKLLRSIIREEYHGKENV